jgi:hypothetical protein
VTSDSEDRFGSLVEVRRSPVNFGAQNNADGEILFSTLNQFMYCFVSFDAFDPALFGFFHPRRQIMLMFAVSTVLVFVSMKKVLKYGGFR